MEKERWLASQRAGLSAVQKTSLHWSRNPELRNFYELLWHLGAAQSDVATLQAEDVDWTERTISFRRCKTRVPVVISFGVEVATILAALPRSGPIRVTRDLIRAGQLLRIEVLDHIILGRRTDERPKDFVSLLELGYLAT